LDNQVSLNHGGDTTHHQPLILMLSEDNELTFYAYTLLNCNFKESTAIPYAAVSFANHCFNLLLNVEVFETLTSKQKMFVLAHEALHIILGHFQRRNAFENCNQKIFNIAADCALNQVLISQLSSPNDYIIEGIVFLKECQTIANEIGESIKRDFNIDVVVPTLEPLKSMEYYYHALMNILNKIPQSKVDKMLSNQDDINKMVDEIIENEDETHNQWFDYYDKIPQDLLEGLVEDLMDKVKQSLSGMLSMKFDSFLRVHKTQNVIKWKRYLKTLIGTKKGNKVSTIKKRNRRFPERLEIRGMKKEYVGNVLIILDTSGSITDKILIHALNEIENLCRVMNFGVIIIQVDTQATLIKKYDPKQKKVKIHSRGGTFLGNALILAKEKKLKFDNVVFFSDGQISFKDIQVINEYTKMKTLFLSTDMLVDFNHPKIKTLKFDIRN